MFLDINCIKNPSLSVKKNNKCVKFCLHIKNSRLYFFCCNFLEKKMEEIKKRNRVKLLELRAIYNINWLDVSKILNRKHETVRQWASKQGKDIPDHSIKLLEILLEQKSKKAA